MAKKDLQQIMQKEWQEVRGSFYYPQLPMPKLTEDVPNGCFNFNDLQISINPGYIGELAQKGCHEETSLNALLGHEVGHYVYYPGSVLNLLRLQKVARESLDEEQAFAAREAFLNIQNNTHLVQDKGYESVPETLKAEATNTKGLHRIMFGLYQELWQKDLGVRLKKEERTLVKRLQGIDYLDRDSQEQNLREFVGLIKEYLEQQKPEQNQPKDHSSGSGFSDNQVREGVRQFAQESQPGEFEQIVGEVLKELEEEKAREAEEGREERTKSLGAGTEKGNLIVARNFYSALSENFSIPVRKKQMQKNGSLYPHSHEEFGMGDEINDLDAFSSPGIIPGVTQKWVRKEGETIADYFGIPDSLVVIDSSGSMPNPNEAVSVPVLGATVIANAYLDNNARVTIYNFSADNLVVGPSKNKERIHETLRSYQGGGTVFNPRTVEDIVREQGSIDVSVVSDMEIHNLSDFLAYVSGLPNVHRVHLFYTNSGNIGSIEQALRDRENVAILPLHSQEDITKITMGELKKSIS